MTYKGTTLITEIISDQINRALLDLLKKINEQAAKTDDINGRLDVLEKSIEKTNN